MKEDASYDLKKSLAELVTAELVTARANRDAHLGVFVHSRRTAPSGLRPLKRYDADVVVAWDAEDEQSDVYLDGAITIAKALALGTKTISKASPVDIDGLDKAIREIERQAGFLEEIKTKSGTIKSASENIRIYFSSALALESPGRSHGWAFFFARPRPAAGSSFASAKRYPSRRCHQARRSGRNFGAGANSTSAITAPLQRAPAA
jgi:hypothetical protein